MTSVERISLDIVLAAVALSVASAVLRSVVGTWRRPAAPLPSPVVPSALHASQICGVINAGTQKPCVLADGHQTDARAEHEHATAWLDDEDPRREVRHRWSANDVAGREEKRYRPAFLPKFTADGERRTK